MELSVLTKWSAAFGITALVASGIASPAYADPVLNKAYGNGNFAVLAGVGSDTTQDVGNGLGAFLGRTGADTTFPWKLASYDAVGSASVVTKRFNDPIYRYNGSGNGRIALLASIGQIATTGSSIFTHSGVESTQTTAALAGKIQYSRSSSGPSAAVAGGVIAHVAFAQDAMTYAVDESSVMPDLTVGVPEVTADGNGVVPSTLWAIYKCVARKIVVEAGIGTKLVDLTYVATGGETLQDIHAYHVQSGSGTAEYWSTKFYGSASAAIPSCVTREGFAGEVWAGKSVQEHDGRAVEGDPGAIMPMSIPQWVAQGNSVSILADTGVVVPDRRNTSVLGKLNGISAITGDTEGSYALNPAMVSDAGAVPATGNNKPSWLGRTMYHIVPSAKMDDVTSPEYAMFSPSGLICTTADATIAQFGFAALSAEACGVQVRTFAPSASTATAAPATNITSSAATTFALTVTFASNGNQGGTVSVVDAAFPNVDLTGITGTSIAVGSTSTTINVPIAHLGKSLTVFVTPNLSGIAEASASVSKFTPVVTATSAGAKNSKSAGKATVTIGNQGFRATGTVEIFDGATRVGTGTLTGVGTVTITVAKMSKGTKTLTVKYLGDANYAPKLDATLSYKVK